MNTLPYDHNHELKEGWLRTIKAIERRCVKPFPPHIKRHKIYQKGSLPTEEVTKLVRMVREHHSKYRIKWYHKLFTDVLSIIQGAFCTIMLLLLCVVGLYTVGFLFFYIPLELGAYFKSPIPFCTSMITLMLLWSWCFDQ